MSVICRRYYKTLPDTMADLRARVSDMQFASEEEYDKQSTTAVGQVDKYGHDKKEAVLLPM